MSIDGKAQSQRISGEGEVYKGGSHKMYMHFHPYAEGMAHKAGHLSSFPAGIPHILWTVGPATELWEGGKTVSVPTWES